MSDSFSIPIERIPLNLAEARSAIAQGLAQFGEPSPSISYRTSASGTHDLMHGDVFVEGRSQYDACWVDFLEFQVAMRFPKEIDLAFFASVATRGNSWFAAAVAYGLAMHFGGRAVYDDSHMLRGIDRYEAVVLRQVLREGLQGTRRF